MFKKPSYDCQKKVIGEVFLASMRGLKSSKTNTDVAKKMNQLLLISCI
jgi:hypothetical protein